ncbi:unnamed protein product, partial [Prorocentrum cordatum]
MRASGVGASMLCGPMIMPGRAGPSPSLAELYGEEAARPLGASAARASEDTQVAAAQEAAATVIQAAFRGHAVRAPCPAREPPAAPEVAAAAPQPEPLTVGARLDQSAALSTPPRLAFGLGAPPAMRASGVGASMLCGPMIMPGRAGPSPSLAELYGEEAARPLGASAARALEDTQVAAAQEAAATQIQAAFRGHAARAPCAARGAEAGCAERREAAEAAATVIQAAFRGHAVRESRPAREPPAAPEVAAAAPQPEPLTVGARLDQSAAVSTPPRLAFGLGTPPALRASGVGAPVLCGPMIMPGRAGPSPSLAELYGEEAARPLGASAARALEDTQVAAAQEAAATVIQAAFRGHAARAPCAARGAEAGCAERREAAEAAAIAIQAAFRGHAVRESRPAREPPAAPEAAAAAPQPEPLTVGARLDQSAAVSTPPRLAFGLGTPPALRASGVGASMLCGPMIMPGRAGPSPSLAELYGEEAARPLGASAARASEDTQVAAAQEAAATQIQAAFRGHAARAPCAARGAEAGCAERREAAEAAATVIQAAFRGHAVRESRPAREPPAAPEVAAAAPQPEPLTVGARLDQSAAVSTPPRLAFGLGAPPALRASGVGAPVLCGPMIMPGRAGPSPSLAELYGEEAARPLGASAARALEDTQVAAAQEAAATQIQAAFRGHAARAPCAARGAEAGCAERREAAEAAATVIQAAFRGHAVRESRPAREPPAAPEVAAAAPQPEPLTVGARLDQSAAVSTPPRLAFGLGTPPALRASGVGAPVLCGPMIMPGRAGPSPSLAELYGEEAARPLGASAARGSEDTQVAAAQEAAATVIQAAFRGHAARAPCAARGAEAGCAERREAAAAAAIAIQAAFRGHAVREAGLAGGSAHGSCSPA